MGFFDKKKEENANMPAPPAAPSAPEMAAPAVNVPDSGKLTPPSVPGVDSLNEIKNQISAPAEIQEPAPSREIPPVPETPSMSTELAMPKAQESSDSLFDLSDLDLGEDEGSNIDVSNEVSNMDLEDNSIDTNVESQEDLSFVQRKSQGSSIVKDEPVFVTTSQFKSLLEIVETVKLKVKESSETHLRLVDIKSEEDIEYENLRKSFQFIEDKLYEVDSLIFDK